MPDHNVTADAEHLIDGQMQRLDLNGTPVVLIRQGGIYYAVGGECTHYNAPLEKGVLNGFCLMCPWHHAAFDIRNGHRMEPPALNDLAHYAVRVENAQIFVTLPQANQSEPQGSADSSDSRVFVIVGGGAAGNAAAEELRRAEFHGQIILLNAAPTLPLDRPNLSKDYLAGEASPEWMPLRPDESWYAARGITLRLNTTVTHIDPSAHTITLSGGESIRYDKLLLATGALPRMLKDVSGTDLAGVFTLREQADADRIIQASESAKRVIIIGGSFIGMEAAAALVGKRKLAVTIVEVESVPFARNFGEEVGRRFQREHEANGVQFRLKAEIKEIIGENGHVTSVALKSGETLAADFVLIGIGVRPNTDFVKDSGPHLDDRDGSLYVSEGLQTNEPDIYAAGDIARYPSATDMMRGQRVEHWRVAEQHGMVAARNILGHNESIGNHVPFFWTKQWKIDLRYVGHAENWDEIVYRHGTPDSERFIACYMAGGKLLAAAGIKADPEMDAIEFIMLDHRSITSEHLRDESFDLIAFATQSITT